MTNFIQINLNRCREAQALLLETAYEKRSNILLISEPHTIPEAPGWYGSQDAKSAIYISESVDPINSGRGQEFVWVDLEDFRIYSCYFSPNRKIEEYKLFLDSLEDSIRAAPNITNLIVTGDFNAHARVWGSNENCHRGNLVLEFMGALNLITINDGVAPTWVRGQSQSFLDLTIVSTHMISRMNHWEVLEAETLSDHLYVHFTINPSHTETCSTENNLKRWSWRKLNLEKLQTFLDQIPVTPANSPSTLARVLEEACDKCMPKGNYRGNKKPLYWWNNEISDLRKQCLGARRTLKRRLRKGPIDQNGAELAEYRNRKKILKIEIRKSKRNCWENLCRQADADPWGLPFRLVTKKIIGRRPIQGLSTPGRVTHIVNTLFPMQPTIKWPELEQTEDYPRITYEEIKICSQKIPTGKAPGPDNIPDLIIKQTATKRPDILCNVFNNCLSEGYFPSIWKVAKLVLLRKGNKPLEEPSSYRPICLLNTTGKFLERIIKSRLEAYMTEKNSLNNRQFGFRKGMSTVDAISKVMETVEAANTGPLRKRRLCAIVTLDVANAFNSANWLKIRQALETKKIPHYLIRIIQSYLSERKLTYGNGDTRQITCGVPQGSVLGPTLWNIMYDDLLDMDITSGIDPQTSATLVAFADDVAVVTTGRNTKKLEEVTNEALLEVAKWMERNGLKLVAQKTEAVIITKKRGYVEPSFILNGITITPKTKLKYLGVELSKKLGFQTHLKVTAEKAERTANALARLMPNVRGPKQATRKLLSTVVLNQILYAAPIWAESLAFTNNIQIITRPQRKIALRTTMAYRTSSTNAILLIAGMIPVHLLAQEAQRKYRRKQNNELNYEERNKTMEEWQKEWNTNEKGQWTKRLIKDVKPWITRKFGSTDFHLTQLLTGHGCFGNYLFKFKKRHTAECVDCKAAMDDAEHTLFRCDRWWRVRRELEATLGGPMEPDTIIQYMLESKDKWEAVRKFVHGILSTKEEEERATQRETENLINLVNYFL